MKKVKFLVIALAIVSLLSSFNVFTIDAHASELYSSDSTVIDYEYDYDADIMVISTLTTSEPYTIDRASGYLYKDSTSSKYFYIISTGEKVAEYSLTANFRYDTTASLAECRSTSTSSSSLKSGWKVSRTSTVDNVSDALGAGRGDFTLYEGSTENNTDSIVIYCDHKGTITKS